jgi:hypothetical protein
MMHRECKNCTEKFMMQNSAHSPCGAETSQDFTGAIPNGTILFIIMLTTLFNLRGDLLVDLRGDFRVGSRQRATRCGKQNSSKTPASNPGAKA